MVQETNTDEKIDNSLYNEAKKDDNKESGYHDANGKIHNEEEVENKIFKEDDLAEMLSAVIASATAGGISAYAVV
ncbi:10000_t:CDS:2 [Racocetra fulgida]|uniref:10000_t:CDS:1 n=1 Tax=Racocetra fulgida TaxID=60492 RepID=A0A9N9BTP2_9GLOM|nr:10000_t:CDS:2 [Racocetra fulgida]